LAVFVLDKRKKPLVRCSKQRARLLRARGRALVHRHYRFTIRLNDRTGGEIRPLLVKIDPGSETTGIAVVTDEDGDTPAKVLCPFELSHAGRQISQALTARAVTAASHCLDCERRLLQRADGYGFAVPASRVPPFGRTAFLPATVASGGF
jgi:hypothetical protein